MTEKLYKTAMDFAELKPTDVVFDAYSGHRNDWSYRRQSVAKVISVEIVPEAVEDAKKNATLNGIKNFEVYADDASFYIYKLASNRNLRSMFSLWIRRERDPMSVSLRR
jgi:23S rRNA (uracil1939-C5)-methyltransferase